MNNYNEIMSLDQVPSLFMFCDTFLDPQLIMCENWGLIASTVVSHCFFDE